jgi:hypothetical protein
VKLSLLPIYTEAYFGSTYLATGTSFIYERNGSNWLVTAWHMLTGRHNESGQPLSKTGGVPDRLVLHVGAIHPTTHFDETGVQYLRWTPLYVPLYQDDDCQRPFFFWHPTRGRKVDVAAMPSPLDPAAEYGHRPIDHPSLDHSRIKLDTGMDAFVLGYPKGLTADGKLPIWKRASIASEPTIPQLDDTRPPRFLIDTATREGMSGGPVFVRHTGYLPNNLFEEGHEPPQQLFVGTVIGFAGLYSGRIGGDDELAAQVGIVWTRRAIEEVIDGGVFAESSFA